MTVQLKLMFHVYTGQTIVYLDKSTSGIPRRTRNSPPQSHVINWLQMGRTWINIADSLLFLGCQKLVGLGCCAPKTWGRRYGLWYMAGWSSNLVEPSGSFLTLPGSSMAIALASGCRSWQHHEEKRTALISHRIIVALIACTLGENKMLTGACLGEPTSSAMGSSPLCSDVTLRPSCRTWNECLFK